MRTGEPVATSEGRATFPTARAETFESTLGGRNRSVLLGCVLDSGESVTCVTKLYHRLESPALGHRLYWVEWVANLLAVALKVPVPDAFVVEISREVAEQIGTALKEEGEAAHSARPTFGTRKIPFPIPLVGSGPLEADLRETAAELAVFDAFIDNPDRRKSNPNLLIDASEPRRLVAIDHDLAFSSFSSLLVGSPRWPLDVLAGHAVEGRFGSKKPGLERIAAAITGLSDALLDALPAQTPPSWLEGGELTRLHAVIDGLKKRRDNVGTWIPTIERWL